MSDLPPARTDCGSGAAVVAPPATPGGGDPNAHVRDYLAHYLAFPHAPHFAVLLDGPWGVGKTHLLRAFLTREAAGQKVAYISLYGVTSSDEIEEALFAALYPAASGKAARVATGVVKALLRHVKYEVDLEKGDLLDRFAADVYVFDDLERNGMKVNEAMGYINQFVEHDGCKVIIVANTQEIAEDERAAFTRRREKIVGKTLEVRSAFDEAYAWFRSKIDHPGAAQLFTDQAGEMASLYDQSGLRNLRVLQQTMWDLERVVAALEERHLAHRAGLVALLRLFTALSFEVKAGRLTAPDLRDRIQGITLGYLDKKLPTPLRAADDRYPGIHLYDDLLDDDVLYDLLISGIVDGVAVRAAVDRSAHFASGEEPAWRTAWHAFERPEEEVLAAIATMDQQFANHEFTVGGEIMHVIGLQLHLSDIGLNELSRAETVERGKRYIDELRRLGTIELAPEPGRDEMRYGGYGGLGMTQANSPEIGEVFQHLVATRAAAAADRHPAIAVELLAEMRANPARFVEQVSGDADGTRYAREPVLAALDPADFTAAFLELEPTAQRAVAMGLLRRYDHARLLHELVGEVAWAQRVETLLAEAAERASPLTRDRLLGILRHSLGKSLAGLSASAPESGH
ncbi:MAG: hypothetical protein EON59_02850 [Alphaproteobacteria bacterium]|nr:MAG: hypothetical protein EON59_02850 [Alphaproteobacteria bacterium]